MATECRLCSSEQIRIIFEDQKEIWYECSLCKGVLFGYETY